MTIKELIESGQTEEAIQICWKKSQRRSAVTEPI